MLQQTPPLVHQHQLSEEFGRAIAQNAHRIHRSLSDSKYGAIEAGQQRAGRLLAAGKGELAGCVSTKIGSSDPYVSNRGASWGNSRMSLVRIV
jgi:hypothetical protein